ncbi:hypothetical protein GMOD_00009919 [Pyrenophora seminiperda CCB06]|uniref:Uncharacterized protein n=1 Tax=Pyrenophora seminiperda CCB06 TaxID=1302712 RepID=A0A3M7M1N6_9PLEO|nr:hypothetical protein GMOD_00009919 [Pyrenophora seminiperda CCB06]
MVKNSHEYVSTTRGTLYTLLDEYIQVKREERKNIYSEEKAKLVKKGNHGVSWYTGASHSVKLVVLAGNVGRKVCLDERGVDLLGPGLALAGYYAAGEVIGGPLAAEIGSLGHPLVLGGGEWGRGVGRVTGVDSSEPWKHGLLSVGPGGVAAGEFHVKTSCFDGWGEDLDEIGRLLASGQHGGICGATIHQ